MFVGDPHGLYRHIVDAIDANPPKAAVLLGDMCYDKPIDQLFAASQQQTALHWIHGNHDTDNSLWFENLFRSSWSAQNLHAQVAGLGDLRVAGLGGVFRGKIWNPNQQPRYPTRELWDAVYRHKRFVQSYEGSKRKHESTIWYEDYERLMMQQADVLVLHEAPTSDRHGHQALDDLAMMLGVRLIVHGHHHRWYTETLDNGIAVVGLGLAQTARLNVDAFKSAKHNDDIFSAFEFGNVAKRNGGWLT